MLVLFWLNDLGLAVPAWKPEEPSTFGILLLVVVVTGIFTGVRNRLVAPCWKCLDA